MTAQSIVLHSKVWFYADPAKIVDHGVAFAKFVRKHIASSPRWTVTPVYEAPMNNGKDRVFAPMQLRFVTSKTSELAKNPKWQQDLFETIWTLLGKVTKHRKFRTEIKIEKSTPLISYSLCQVGGGAGRALSRWMLLQPVEPLVQPAQQVEEALYRLVSCKLRRLNEDHKSCDGAAAFSCIEELLYEQKRLYAELRERTDELAKMQDTSFKTVNSAIALVETLDKILGTIENLAWQHVGKAAPSTSRWVPVRLVQKLIKPRMAALPIKSKALEKQKKAVKHELAAFRRIVPLMAAHIRLRNATQWSALKNVTDRAPEGPEKSEMPMKMCIDPSKLHDAATRQANFVAACDFYYEEYDKTMAEVEALVKCFGREMGQDHQNGGCFGSRAVVQRQCLHSGVAKEAAVAEAVQELMNEKI